jgi:hypothetical protein
VSEARSKAMPFAVASAAACALGIAGAFLLPPSLRVPALYGAVAASLGAVCALTALVRATGKGVNGLLLGFSIGFLCRAALVGIGLVASGARDNLALVYAAAFFTLYVSTQVIEVLFVHSSSRPQGAPR